MERNLTPITGFSLLYLIYAEKLRTGPVYLHVKKKKVEPVLTV